MGKNKIYVICPDRKNPIGGIKQLYRLVDILNANGHEAYILHKKKNFRVDWYINNTPIAYFPGLFKKLSKHRKNAIIRFFENIIFGNKTPEKDSILVFPEIYGPHINLFESYEFIIFNQNCYYTFEQFPFFQPAISPYQNPNLLGCLVVSEDSKKYLSSFFPKIKTKRIRLGLPDIFSYSSEKKKQVAYMPRKLAEDANQIYHFITHRPCFADWEFVAIDRLNEQEVATTLQQSAIFLCFNYCEGFGLPPVEAMACGCYVIGYKGNAGSEYLNSEFSTVIEDRNVQQFITELENFINQYNTNPQQIINKGLKASQFVLKNYNKTNETADVITAWNELTCRLPI